MAAEHFYELKKSTSPAWDCDGASSLNFRIHRLYRKSPVSFPKKHRIEEDKKVKGCIEEDKTVKWYIEERRMVGTSVKIAPAQRDNPMQIGLSTWKHIHRCSSYSP